MKFGNTILFFVVLCMSGYVSACDDNFSSLGILLDEIGNRRPRQTRHILSQKILFQSRAFPRPSERLAIFKRMKGGTKLATIVEENQYDSLPYHRQATLPLSARVCRQIIPDPLKHTTTVCWRNIA